MAEATEARGDIVLTWELRTFEHEAATVPVPVVGISACAVEAVGKSAGIAIGRDEHCTLERLVAGRIFNVCGFTSLGADANTNIVPTRARPEALRVSELAAQLIAAMEAFDAASDGRGKNNFDHRIHTAHGADPREMIQAVAGLYARYVPTLPAEKQRGRAVFIADLREQVLRPAISKHAEGEYRQPSIATLCRFLAALDQFVLRPLDRIGIAPPDRPSPIRRRAADKAPSVALVRGGGKSENALRKIISRDLRPYDAEVAAVQGHWANVVRTKPPR